MLETTLTGVMDEAILEELTTTTQRFRGKLGKVTLLEVSETEPERGKLSVTETSPDSQKGATA